MTPEEKAKELVDKFINASFNCKDCNMPFCDIKCTQLNLHEAKQCSLIAVDELIKATTQLASTYFWQKVKNEIEKL
jgi:hypothetical protein